MKNYSLIIESTPQTQPIKGRADMVENNAGGYGFKASPWVVLERFLLIGSEGGTYYVKEKKLTQDNAQNVLALIKTEGHQVVAVLMDFALNNRAPKMDAILFTLALCAAYGDIRTKNCAYQAIPQVCKTATHLFMFLANIKGMRKWSRGLRSAVANFYLKRDAESMAYQILKYRNRAGYTHKDAIKLSHPGTKDSAKNQVLKYAIGKCTGEESGLELIKFYESVQTSKVGKDIAAIIACTKLSWEMIPNEMLNDKDVLDVLVHNMPMTALMRNLNRFSYNGLTDTKTALVLRIIERLTDQVQVEKSGIHPVNVINSMSTYAAGVGVLGNKTWTPNQSIVDALQKTYELALQTITPTNKRILIGVDISGSMQAPVGGMHLNASQISHILSVTMLKTERNAELMWFDTDVHAPKFGARTSIDEILKSYPRGGGTDCALPMAMALVNKASYDAIVILTDTESWAGATHGVEVLAKYRHFINPNVKIIEISLVANEFSGFPDNDKNVLRIVGFDASAITVMNKFITE